MKYFSFSPKDALITAAILLCTGGLCLLLRIIDDSDVYVSMLFLLAVLLIARFTEGYACGIFASFVGVLAINYVFTYPFFAFNFTLSGYPLTILSMLSVAIITSTLTSKSKAGERMKIEAEREKTRSNLLRALSHDLRTPLTSIYGASCAIIENDDRLSQKERIELLNGVREDSQWLIRMVENLLSITRIDGDSAKIEKKPEAVEEVISESVSKFKKRFPEFPVSVSVPEKLLMVPMDAMLIEQVMANLLENAALHGKNVTEIAVDVAEDRGFARFAVSDNGEGIAKRVLPHVFDGCTKEECVDSKKNMGIGLSVCKTIIMAHDGSMGAENLSPHGALFEFFLPLEGGAENGK